MKVVIAIILLAMIGTVLSAVAIACTKDYCMNIANCNNATEEECQDKDQRLKQHGSFCGCCDTCIAIISKFYLKNPKIINLIFLQLREGRAVPDHPVQRPTSYS